MNLRDEIEELKAKIKELEEAEAQRMGSEPWKPKPKEKFYYSDVWVSSCLFSTGDFFTRELINNGNYFKTKELAEKDLKITKANRKLRKIAEHLNGGWVPEWSDRNLCKYYIICYDGRFSTSYAHLSAQDVVYFKDQDTTFKAIELIKFDKDILELFPSFTK